MKYYMFTSSQLAMLALLVALLLSSSIIGATSYQDHQDLPTVLVDDTGKCIRVVNYKNGDGYSCEDQDVILRRYKLDKFKDAK